jgi:glycosyltransferase involved in cell wall biosynthesis
LEYVVINDGSTDDSDAVIQQYKYDLYHYETWPGYRTGPAPAINKGFSLSSGEIMGWLNSDDLLIPNSLFVVAEIFAQFPEVDWLTGVATTIDIEDRYIRSRKYNKNLYDYLIGDWAVIQQESTFWRRSLWDAAGGGLDENLSIAFDSDLWSRFLLHAQHFHVDCPLGAYRKVPSSTSIRKAQDFSDVTDKSIDKLRDKVPKNILMKCLHYRIFKWILRTIGSPRLTNILGSIFGNSSFAYKSITYMPMHSKWRIYSEW